MNTDRKVLCCGLHILTFIGKESRAALMPPRTTQEPRAMLPSQFLSPVCDTATVWTCGLLHFEIGLLVTAVCTAGSKVTAILLLR